MQESGPESPKPLLDVAQAQLVLGYEAAPLDPSQLQPGQVDERRVILEEALAAQDEMRSSMVAAAQKLGMPVPQEEVAAWTPNVAQVEGLRHRLARHRKRARILDGFDQFIDDQRMAAEALGTPLYPQQQDMIIQTNIFFSREPRNFAGGGKGGHVNAPPGVGKTGVINTICAAAKYNEDPEERIKIVVIVDSINVMNQTHGGEEAKRGFGKFAPHLDVGMRFADSHDTTHDITIMPAASAQILMEKGEMPDADIVVLDEVDEYGRGKPGEQLGEYCKDKLTVGLSATVDDATRDLLPHEIYNMSLPEGIHFGLLAETTAEVLRVNTDFSKVRLPEDPVLRKQMIEQLKLRARLDDIKARIKKDIQNGAGGILVRVPAGDDINIARQFALELREDKDGVVVPNDGTWPGQFKTIKRAIRAVEIGGKQQQGTKGGRKFQKTVFDSYEEGDTDVLITVKAIRRGWDNNAFILYDADTGGNWREKLQMYGRVTRRAKGKRARIYNYYDDARPDQYSGVLALGGRPGQDKITVGEEAPNVMPHRLGESRRLELLSGDLLEGLSSVAVIDTVTVSHGQADEIVTDTAVPPAEEPIAESPAGNSTEDPPTTEEPAAGPESAEPTAEPAANDETRNQELTFASAADRLDISRSLLSEIYRTHGYDPDSTVHILDLETMLELSHPELLVKEPLPSRGYTSDADVLELVDIPNLRLVRLRTLAQYSGYLAKRFIGPDGKVGRYYRDEQVLEIVETIANKQRKQNI